MVADDSGTLWGTAKRCGAHSLAASYPLFPATVLAAASSGALGTLTNTKDEYLRLREVAPAALGLFERAAMLFYL
jgi:hypothetical protein